MIFKLGKTSFDVDVEVNENVKEVKLKLEELTHLVNIKLIYGGKTLKDDVVLLLFVPGGNSAKVTIMGTDSAVLENQQNATSLLHNTRVIDDLNEDSATISHVKTLSVSTSKHTKRSQYRFHRIETLPDLPERDKALEILNTLANDVGVLAVMEKHKFTVGALCELYPEGYVGVSETCVMGLNENHGQRILLRLRTDDLKGFRKILSIRKTLYHELAHNVHSEHNDQFHLLMRQIEKETALLDWRNSAAQTTGYESRRSNHSNTLHDRADSRYYHEEESSVSGGVYTLGGGSAANDLLQHILPAKYLAGTAAIMRLSAEEQEVEDNCGGAVTKHTPDHSSTSANSNNVGNGDVSSDEDASNRNSESEIHMDTVHQSAPVAISSNESVLNAIVAIGSELSVEQEMGTSVDDAVDAVVVSEGDSNTQHAMDEDTASVEEIADTVAPTATNKVRRDSQVLLQSVQSAVLGAIDESVAFALSVDSSSAPIEKMLQLRSAIETMLNSAVCSEMVEELCDREVSGVQPVQGAVEEIVGETLVVRSVKLLLKIVTNAKDHMGSNSAEDAKYRTIKKTTATFQKYVASVPGALDVLYAAGFSELEDHSLRLTRQDPGLLYVVCGMLTTTIDQMHDVLNAIK